MSTSHVAAVARAAMCARGFEPDLTAVRDAVAVEVARRTELASTVLPARWPALARTWRDLAPPVAERLPAMVALGERHARVLLCVAGGGTGMAVETAMLGGLFNAAITMIDQVCDTGDSRLLATLTPDVLGALLGDGKESALALGALRRFAGNHPHARTAVELMGSWAVLARGVRANSGNHPAWTALCSTLHSLLEAQRTVTSAAGGPPGTDPEAVLVATRHKSMAPSLAIAQIVALARDRGDPPPRSLWLTANRLGLVFCLADDLVDIVDDARAGRPNVHLLLSHPAGGRLCDPELYATMDGAAAQLSAVVAPTGHATADRFAAELVTRWLRWDEQERRLAAGSESGEGGAGGTAARSALRLLLAQRAKGYPGAAHELTLPRGQRGAERPETHADLGFAQAVALDTLIDAAEADLPVDNCLLYEEGIQLLLAKHPTARGGWSYLRSVPELPPDADDLAEVLRVLARLGGRPLAAACDEAVRIALDGADHTGGIPTWIVDRQRGGAGAVEMRRYVEVVGGGGAHPEVVANLLGALALADPVRYGRAVACGASYLAGTQRPDGSWTSVWYAGPYYGTFRAAAVLSAAAPAWRDERARARAFLREHQRDTGGWDTGPNESLSTAFAVLGLCTLDPHRSAGEIAAGAERLVAIQAPDGGWPASAWIEFPTRDGPVSYGSAMVTTAFCLKALLAAACPR